MLIRKLLCMSSVLFLSQATLQADPCCCNTVQQETPAQTGHYGSSGFGVTDPSLWYTITTHSYPESTPLSLERNKGVSEGNVYLSPTGFTIGEKGSYWFSITAFLQNPGTDSVLVPVFLAQNEAFDEVSPSVGSVVALAPGELGSAHGTGIIKDIEAGTRLSLVATNGGDPLPRDVVVVGWGISLFKLP